MRGRRARLRGAEQEIVLYERAHAEKLEGAWPDRAGVSSPSRWPAEGFESLAECYGAHHGVATAGWW